MRSIFTLLRATAPLLGLSLLGTTVALAPQPEEAFIGWKGETYKPSSAGVPAVVNSDKTRWIQVVSWKPRAFIYHNFLTDEEAEHIKKMAAPMMKRSTVVGAGGESVLDDYRTSYGTFIKRKADPVIEAIEERVSQWARIPAINAEDMQVLRYGQGQQYKPHMDSLRDDEAGPRVCTVLLYLNDVIQGGETAFPNSKHWVDPSLPKKLGPLSKCANGSVAFKPKKGDAFMFWSIHPDGKKEDSKSLHTGCPVLQGVKWTATKWLHGRPFRPSTFGNKEPYELVDPGLCKDYDPRCAEWAKSGECKNNPKFMIGDYGNAGHCSRACGACTPCTEGDKQCYNENRQKSGFLVYSELELDSDQPAQQQAG